MGTIAAHAKILNAIMISASAHSLGEIVDFQQPGAAVLKPISQLDPFSKTITENFCNQTNKYRLNQNNYSNASNEVSAIKRAAQF